jgi:transcriptional regulator with XRE-family HTH domain
LRQLSQQSGVERGLLSKLERGLRPQVSLQVAMRIAKALGVTLDYLAGMYEDDDQGDGEPADMVLVSA